MNTNPYRVILDVLLNMTDKRLSMGALYSPNEQCGCAMGAFIPASVREAARNNSGVATWRPGGGPEFTERVFEDYCVAAEVPANVAYEVQLINDDERASYQTPSGRYARVVRKLSIRAAQWEERHT